MEEQHSSRAPAAASASEVTQEASSPPGACPAIRASELDTKICQSILKSFLDESQRTARFASPCFRMPKLAEPSKLHVLKASKVRKGTLHDISAHKVAAFTQIELRDVS